MKAINNRDYSTLIAAATQKIPCDLTVKNVKLVNVLTGEIYPASVDVKDGVIVHVQPGEACDSQSKTTVDGQGKYLLHAVDNSHLLHASVAELRKDQNLDAAALAADVLACIKLRRTQA